MFLEIGRFLLISGLIYVGMASPLHSVVMLPTSTISAHTSTETNALLPDVGHIDLLTTPEIEPVLATWLVGLE